MKDAPGAKLLWIFDFDGTLSPIVPDRKVARLHPACRALLRDLVRCPSCRVAVLTSRTVEDLLPRVPIPGVFLGGNSGLEWQFPCGRRILPGTRVEKRMDGARRAIEPRLSHLAAIPGVEVEDKRWSASIHYRRVFPDALPRFHSLIEALQMHPGVRVYEGRWVVEVQYLASVNKSFGVRRLYRLLDVDPSRERMIFAGDDANDEAAMRWVLSRGGTAIAVGGQIRLRGVLHVGGPAALARATRALAEPTHGHFPVPSHGSRRAST